MKGFGLIGMLYFYNPNFFFVFVLNFCDHNTSLISVSADLLSIMAIYPNVWLLQCQIQMPVCVPYDAYMSHMNQWQEDSWYGSWAQAENTQEETEMG